jgi:hypothetical protein
MDEKRELLRHALATVAYRAKRTLEGAPDDFATLPGAGRQPAQILAHMGDLFDWALSMAAGNQRWNNSLPKEAWAEEQKRFFATLQAFDDYLASGEELHAPVDRLFQGPVADALTHVGQLAMLRRLAAAPVCSENFYVARIEAGKVDADQPAAVQPF